MNEPTRPSESDQLRQSWEQYDAETLDTYLVSGVEDPRINVQSILNRAILCDTLFPGQYTRIIDEELRFGYAVTWFLAQRERGAKAETLRAAISDKRRDVCPDFIIDTFYGLEQTGFPCPNYISLTLQEIGDRPDQMPEGIDIFEKIWARELKPLSHGGCSLFEPACGSANDFRYLSSFGFARFVRYLGMDISSKNIANARCRFPDTDFRIGDILATDFADNAFDFSSVHDLFEHLSIEAMQRAIEELLRVTRREAWVHLFNAANIATHHVRAVSSYYWNTLSIGKLVGIIERAASRVEVISIAELAKAKFGFDHYYNPGAYTIIATR